LGGAEVTGFVVEVVEVGGGGGVTPLVFFWDESLPSGTVDGGEEPKTIQG